MILTGSITGVGAMISTGSITEAGSITGVGSITAVIARRGGARSADQGSTFRCATHPLQLTGSTS